MNNDSWWIIFIIITTFAAGYCIGRGHEEEKHD
jgi:hypothetical protein